MNSLASVWAKLDARRRAIVAAATLGTLVAVALLARGPGPGEMALLYAGLEPAAAGEVVAALEARGTPFEVRGDAVWVPAASRDLDRVSLAAEGLPAASSQGYELLDGLSGFGTTAQMFDAAAARAREGELARTILAVPEVRAARVHIATDPASPFRRGAPVTASVTVTTQGGTLAPPQARAIRHLVAAAVPGLAPADVALVDSVAGLLDEEDRAPDTQAEALRLRALRLLEARVGPGNAVVEVAVETVTETETLRERTLDPDSRVAISTEASDSETRSQGAGGAVTVASNLPDGEGAGGGTSDQGSESRSLTNYEVGETSREVLRAPGGVRRLTVAVLVNDPAPAADGAPAVRPAEEVAALGELVGAAVGLDEGRGDRLTIRSMPFEARPAPGSDPATPGGAPLDLGAWARPVLLALVALGLGLFVVRPLLRPGAATLALPAPEAAALPAPSAAAAGGARGIEGRLALGGPPAGPPGASAAGEAIEDARVVDPVTRLRRLIESRQEETAQILQSWIDDAPPAPLLPGRGEA